MTLSQGSIFTFFYHQSNGLQLAGATVLASRQLAKTIDRYCYCTGYIVIISLKVCDQLEMSKNFFFFFSVYVYLAAESVLVEISFSSLTPHYFTHFCDCPIGHSNQGQKLWLT